MDYKDSRRTKERRIKMLKDIIEPILEIGYEILDVLFEFKED